MNFIIKSHKGYYFYSAPEPGVSRLSILQYNTKVLIVSCLFIFFFLAFLLTPILQIGLFWIEFNFES